MSSYEVGTRVFAWQKADQEKVYSYGHGVYAGDFVPPGQETPAESTLAICRQVIQEGDENPERYFGLIDYAVSKGDLTPEEGEERKTQELVRREEDKKRPIEDRALELYLSSAENPRIDLDDGSVVWGFQCWWGPEEREEEKAAGREIVMLSAQEA